MATEDYINKETRYYLTDYYVKYYYEHPETEIYAFFVELYTTLSLTGEYRYTIQSDEYFLMGDNRNNSTDSRMVGPVKKSDLLGKMEILIPYGTNFFVGIWKALFA
jgi:signal peptidase I